MAVWCSGGGWCKGAGCRRWQRRWMMVDSHGGGSDGAGWGSDEWRWCSGGCRRCSGACGSGAGCHRAAAAGVVVAAAVERIHIIPHYSSQFHLQW
nr:hypothetical protein [Tanacetum cinerariifolium]